MSTRDLFSRHQKIAFQFSGGRDSLAALLVLKEYWGEMTVYHLDAGDSFPETEEVIRWAAERLPRLVRVQGKRRESIAQFGLPSDLVPAANTAIGRLVSGAMPIQGRYDCCARSLMVPMHDRMLEDGVTLIVRGQRNADYVTPPLRSGESNAGFEYFYPIEQWSDEMVMAYLEAAQAPVTPFYAAGMTTTPDCMRCPAWWSEGRAAYLKNRHPDAYNDYQTNLAVVAAAIAPALTNLAVEQEHRHG